MSIDLRTSWDKIAEVRTEHSNRGEISYGKHEPSELHLSLLGELQGKRILDLGCGAGGNCLAFANAGATVVGVDFSINQIEKARMLCAEAKNARFQLSDIVQFCQGEPDASYDVAFSTFVLLYVEPLFELFAQVHRILRPGGILVFSMKHRLAEITEVRDGTVFVKESYFDTGSYEWTWRKGETKVELVSYSRTPGQIVNMLYDAGFIVERLIEPEPMAEHESPTEDELTLAAKIPTAMIWKARRG